MAQRYSPDPDPRDPIKPLRLRDEDPGGLLGFLMWWRKRGGVFWWSIILGVLSIITLIGVLVPVSRSMGHLDFRAAPDVTASIHADKTAVSTGDDLVLEIVHENIGGSEAGAVTIDIELPDELTATGVQPGTPACSQAGKLERFASEEAGAITGEPGGTMKCLLGTRLSGAKGSIILETTVGDVPDGSLLNINVWLSTYQTDHVAKDEDVWNNNCISIALPAGSNSSGPSSGTFECNSLAFVSRTIALSTREGEVVPREALTLVVSHENIGGLDAEPVAIDIKLPNELTALRLQHFVDNRALTDQAPKCSHPNQLEEFEKEGSGQITDTAGGTLTCNVGTRKIGAEAKIELVTVVAPVVGGAAIDIEVCARRETAAAPAAGDCKTIAVPAPSQ